MPCLIPRFHKVERATSLVLRSSNYSSLYIPPLAYNDIRPPCFTHVREYLIYSHGMGISPSSSYV